jgi:protein-serine/threonine kinase
MGNRHIKKISKEIKNEKHEKEITSKMKLNKETKILDPDSNFCRNKSNSEVKSSKLKFSFGNEESTECTEFYNSEPNSLNNNEYKNSFIFFPDISDLLINPSNKNQYNILKLIGNGFYSQVFLAENSFKNDTLLAIKKIKKKRVNSFSKFAYVLREKDILKSIENPFIIQLCDNFQDYSNLYLIFPFYDFDLFHFIKFVGNLPNKIENFEKILKFILAQVYLALIYLHENKILFRDLKPENIIIDKLGSIKLIDFGLALNNVDEDSKISEICGTNEYVAPEIILKEPYNLNCDWWAFGIFMHELFYGSPPFQASNQKQVFEKIINENLSLNSYSKLCNHISDDARDLMLYLLNKEKDYRIKSEHIQYHPFFNEINFEEMKKGGNYYPSPLKELIKKLQIPSLKDSYIISKIENLDENFEEIDQTLFMEF